MSWLGHILGLDNLSGPWYGFWSGFGSDVSELALVGALAGLLRKHNCHVRGCWRIGRHPHGQWVLCAKHHPLGAPTVEHIENTRQFHEQVITEIQELRHVIQRGGFGDPTATADYHEEVRDGR